MDWPAIAPLFALGVGALLGIAAIWYKVGRMEAKLDLTLRALREHTHADGSAASTPIPVEAD